ncbi:carbohydrate ABC transporter permease [Paenibacillus humicola]|uniref:carbohydrate ABC transporter permease n=1 Tax=Paenibacillus humicola TaxID=3110540 RepID=UPI00237B8AF1|nr:sugar ABC transporter permease [Paenibacillus humicola]
MSRRNLTETLTGYLFIAPILLGLTVLTLVPILVSFFFSLTDWSLVQGFKGIHVTGFKNFSLLFRDHVFLKSMANNFIFILVVPATMAVSIVLAVIINKHVYFKSLFKVVYFMPYISSIVAVAIVCQVLFHPEYGPVNETLHALGVANPPKWLADQNYALLTVMMISVWAGLGYNLIIYMAGLQNIPRDLYEAAEIDGASPMKQFFRITLPLLSPTSFFLTVTGVIGSFKVFDIIVVLTGGGPSFSTSVMVYYLYDQAFVNLKTGYASSVSVVLLFCVLAITLAQFYGQKKWVNY